MAMITCQLWFPNLNLRSKWMDLKQLHHEAFRGSEFSIPIQLSCASRLKPSGQRGLELHLKEPTVFTHSSCPQLWLCCAHSFISEMKYFTSHWGERTRLTKNDAQIQRAAAEICRYHTWPHGVTVVKWLIWWRRTICRSSFTSKVFLPRKLNLD